MFAEAMHLGRSDDLLRDIKLAKMLERERR